MDTRSGVFKIASIGGIDIKLHWSWLLILLFVTWSLAQGRLPEAIPGADPTTYWLLGLVGSLLFFISVLVHELSHSFAALARGYKVHDIVLFIFGGVSNIEDEPKKASDEFLIAVVGPLSSLLLAVLFYVLSIPLDGAARAMMIMLAGVNFLLAVFNMLPGFPLDGGRVLRSIIWGFNHNYQSATRIAGMVGQLVAYLLIFWGLYESFFLNNFFGGLWIAFIGWFLLNAAQQSVSGTAVRDMLRGVTVSQVMQPAPPVSAPQMTLAQLLTQYVLPHNLRAIPVADAGRLVGIVTLTDIRDVPQDEWGMKTVGQVMTGPDELRVVRPFDGLERAMELLGEGDFDQLPVVDAAGQLVGMLSRAHLLRWMQIRNELHLQPAQPVKRKT